MPKSGYRKFPFNLTLPENVFIVRNLSGTHIGYAYPDPQPLTHLDDSIKHRVPKHRRWTALMLDGTVVTRNAFNRRRAIQLLRRRIAHRARKKP